MLKVVNTAKNRKKNERLVNVIKTGLSDLQNEIKEMSDDELKLKSQIRQQILLKRFLSLIG